MRIEAAPPRRRPLSLTALIDVVFILLVFFMLVTRLVNWGQLELSLAVADGGAPTASQPLDMATLRVLPETVMLDGRQLSVARAAEMLSRRAGEAPGLRVFLAPEPAVPLQRLVVVLETLQRAGLDNVRLLDQQAAERGGEG